MKDSFNSRHHVIKRKKLKKDQSGPMIYVIGDVQAYPGQDVKYLRAIGHQIISKRPDYIVQLGDFADMESLSSYDKGKASFEGRRVIKDIEASHKAMMSLLGPIREFNLGRKPEDQYRPTMVLVLGNHEYRINRATNDNPELAGLLSIDDLAYPSFGWKVFDYQDTVDIEGVIFSHHVNSGAMGRPIGTARGILTKKFRSVVVGHQQGRMIADDYTAAGDRICAIILGSSYEHSEGYLGPQGNRHFRGTLILHDVNNGEFIEQFNTLEHIKRKYGHL